MAKEKFVRTKPQLSIAFAMFSVAVSASGCDSNSGTAESTDALIRRFCSVQTCRAESACLANMEDTRIGSESRGCSSEFRAALECNAAHPEHASDGGECNDDDYDTACALEDSRFSHCLAAASDAGTSSDAGADAHVDAPSN